MTNVDLATGLLTSVSATMTTLLLSPLKKHQSGWEKKLHVHRMRYLDYLIIECSFVVITFFVCEHLSVSFL